MVVRIAVTLAGTLDLVTRIVFREDGFPVGQALLGLAVMAQDRVDGIVSPTAVRSPAPATVASAPTPADADPGSVRFDPIEASVIELAGRDPVSSVDGPGPFARLVGVVFGRAPSLALADPRLEALRRMAVLAWRRVRQPTTREVEAFLAAGYTAAHRARLSTIVDRRSRDGRERDVAGAAHA